MSVDQIKVELCSWWGRDESVAHQAWASSFSKEIAEAKSFDDVRRIVSGVVTNHHDTPKERLFLEYYASVPIFVERQADKYRVSLQFQDIQIEAQAGAFGRLGITQNELSGRYRTIPERAYGLPNDVAYILEKCNPNFKLDHYPEAERIQEAYDARLREQHESYQAALQYLRVAEKEGRVTNAEYKRAREVLRGELGTAYITDMRWILNGNAFEHVMNQRLDPHAQEETRYMALLMLREAMEKGVAPVLFDTMVVANKWQPWIEEIEAWERNELP